MKRSAILSVIIAAIFMLIYVWIRFKEFSFGASSVLPLLHDVFVLLAFYAVLRWTVGNTFIACMLTLVGYSINATIVVFDRIRENLHTNKNLAEVVNCFCYTDIVTKYQYLFDNSYHGSSSLYSWCNIHQGVCTATYRRCYLRMLFFCMHRRLPVVWFKERSWQA